MTRLLPLLSVLSIACQNTPPQTAPTPVGDRPWRTAAFSQLRAEGLWLDEEPLGSDLGLSAGDAADSTIERLLAHRLTLPPGVSVAILHFPGARVGRSWFSSRDVSELTQALADSMVAALSSSPRVTRAVVLPALFVGEKPTIAGLREGAARLQARVLLVYRPSCRFYERVPFVGSTQYRALCTIEAAALDTRSGVIPWSTVVTREYVTQRQRGDFDAGGTWRRAQHQALLVAGADVSGRIGTFLVRVPVEP